MNRFGAPFLMMLCAGLLAGCSLNEVANFHHGRELAAARAGAERAPEGSIFLPASDKYAGCYVWIDGELVGDIPPRTQSDTWRIEHGTSLGFMMSGVRVGMHAVRVGRLSKAFGFDRVLDKPAPPTDALTFNVEVMASQRTTVRLP